MMRGLTPLAKVKALEFWEDAKRDYQLLQDTGALPPNPGGLGYPDPDVYDLCDRLNRLDGIVTLQSCSGHRHPGEDGVSLWSGELWIFMTLPVRDRFIDQVPELLRRERIENTRLIFQHGTMDVADINFAGMNVGADALKESADSIVAFFQWITL